jgi:AcrR family transcriptional regulator
MASNEKRAGAPRPYRKRERARREQETRRRITEAALELHRTVGPARTTVSDVAARAGVGRMTVYNHFPTDADLLASCSGHFAAGHPLPDMAAWRAIADPDERLRVALDDLYAWFRETSETMGKVLRDAALIPALGEIMDRRWWPAVDAMVDALASGRGLRGARARDVRAALRLAVDLGTWETLTASGLDDRGAARVAARMVGASAG